MSPTEQFPISIRRIIKIDCQFEVSEFKAMPYNIHNLFHFFFCLLETPNKIIITDIYFSMIHFWHNNHKDIKNNISTWNKFIWDNR